MVKADRGGIGKASASGEAIDEEQQPVHSRHACSAHKHSRHLGVIEPARNGSVDCRYNEGGHGGGAGGAGSAFLLHDLHQPHDARLTRHLRAERASSIKLGRSNGGEEQRRQLLTIRVQDLIASIFSWPLFAHQFAHKGCFQSFVCSGEGRKG